ncbi:MGMT family protein [Diplocloster modestus]|uniref:MGMT family protein n=1 Tax=Diplocloster modestus TaxID=2850322 RepID=A0ABS6KD94_9FIRM|nr:MGMT family protein [Diplocloster modestus]MBU9728492.1 MGMT family protein [Diplocloster modestus]
MASELTKHIYQIVQDIPYGKVATYGQIARLAGNPRAARAVGFAMRNVPDGLCLPCHRVIFQDGSLCTGFAFGDPQIQYQMLKKEGITFDAQGRVRLDRHRYIPGQRDLPVECPIQ